MSDLEEASARVRTLEDELSNEEMELIALRDEFQTSVDGAEERIQTLKQMARLARGDWREAFAVVWGVKLR